MSANADGRELRCAIVGAGGYSGGELVSILLGRPNARIVGLFGSDRRGVEAPQRISDVFRRFRSACDMPIVPATLDAIAACRPDVVFLATPHIVSYELAPRLALEGITVIDLSAAFRLKDAALYPKHYAFDHAQAVWLEKAVYGVPELFRAKLQGAKLIAVAGCYPTSAILPLAPLVRAGAIHPARAPIIDSVSGVSGAGRHATLTSSFCEVSLQPYNVLKHRHQPEIDAYAGTRTVFTPHLGPFDRGILSTIHAELSDGWPAQRIFDTFHAAYAHEPFIRLLPAGVWPSIAAVQRQNFCDIGWAVDEAHKHLIVVSALDNLVKGAAGQAVQCMNAAFALPETMGLLDARPPEGTAR